MTGVAFGSPVKKICLDILHQSPGSALLCSTNTQNLHNSSKPFKISDPSCTHVTLTNAPMHTLCNHECIHRIPRPNTHSLNQNTQLRGPHRGSPGVGVAAGAWSLEDRGPPALAWSTHKRSKDLGPPLGPSDPHTGLGLRPPNPRGVDCYFRRRTPPPML